MRIELTHKQAIALLAASIAILGRAVNETGPFYRDLQYGKDRLWHSIQEESKKKAKRRASCK